MINGYIIRKNNIINNNDIVINNKSLNKSFIYSSNSDMNSMLSNLSSVISLQSANKFRSLTLFTSSRKNESIKIRNRSLTSNAQVNNYNPKRRITKTIKYSSMSLGEFDTNNNLLKIYDTDISKIQANNASKKKD